MATLPQPSERRRSVVDDFCTQTYQAPELQARHMRGIASTLGVVCLLLLGCLGLSVWRADAMEQQRDALAQELRLERGARLEASLTARDAEMNAANLALDTTVRRDIVDQRMQQQDERSAELQQLARQVERDKLVKADCATPRSILAASGL